MFKFDDSAQTRKLSFGVKQLIATLLLSLCLASAGSARAATYSVSPSGSNGNPGTSAQPWLTIQKAANTMVAGDTTIVEPGYYPEKVVSMANGTAANPITFLAQAGVTNDGFDMLKNYNVANGFSITKDEIPVYEPGPGGTYVGFVIRLVGIGNVLENFQLGNIASTNGIASTNNYNFYNLAVGGAFNVVSNGNLFNVNATVVNMGGFSNVVENCLINVTFGNDCFHMANGTNNAIRCCVVSNVVMVGSSQSGVHTDFVQMSGSYGANNQGTLIERNIVYPGAIQVCNMDSAAPYSVGTTTFRNNIFFGSALHASIWTPNTAFYNNAFILCGMNFSEELYFISGDPKNGTPYNCSVFNNLFIECGSWSSQPTSGFYTNPGSSPSTNNFRADYNYASGFGWQPKYTYLADANVGDNVLIGIHDISGGNPGFANFPYTNTSILTCVDPNCAAGSSPVLISTNYNFDLHLLASSILRNAGTNLSAIFTNDFAGNARPATGAWSLGPFQFTESAVISPPSNLRIVAVAGVP
jgi:hypothetical protein